MLPLITNITSYVNAQQVLEVRIEAAYLVSAESIYALLETNTKSFDEIGITRDVLKSGALGIMSAVAILLLEFKRGVMNG